MPPKYKPGGKRFPPRVTPKQLPKQIINNIAPASSSLSASPQNSGGQNEEAEDQFELELCWCIQQLEITLDSGKLGEKQTLDATKSLGLLKSNTVAMIRKRQVMRNTFGDYRVKMAQDEKKHGKYVANVKFASPKPNISKSVFLKKAAVLPGDHDAPNDDPGDGTNNHNDPTSEKTFVMNKQPSDIPFTFNFSEPEPK